MIEQEARAESDGRASAFAFRGRELDIPKIDGTIGVRTILEGSVRVAGNRIRVAAQWINEAHGCSLWSQCYDREMADVFEIQDEIATAIAAALTVKLAPQPGRAERYKPNLPAYEAYLRVGIISSRLRRDPGRRPGASTLPRSPIAQPTPCVPDGQEVFPWPSNSCTAAHPETLGTPLCGRLRPVGGRPGGRASRRAPLARSARLIGEFLDARPAEPLTCWPAAGYNPWKWTSTTN